MRGGITRGGVGKKTKTANLQSDPMLNLDKERRRWIELRGKKQR